MHLYLYKMESESDSESFFKVGVTAGDPELRFSFGSTKVRDSGLPMRDQLDKLFKGEKYISDHPYETDLIHSVLYKYEGDALIAERDLLKSLGKHTYSPMTSFSGATECFSGDEELVQDVKSFMDEDSTKRNLDAPDRLLYKIASIDVKETDPIKKHECVLEKCSKLGQ